MTEVTEFGNHGCVMQSTTRWPTRTGAATLRCT